MFYAVTRLILLVFFRLFYNLKVYDADKVPKKGGFILASNHLSFFDPPVLACAAKRQLNFLAREDLFRAFVIGWFIKRLKAIPVKRDFQDMRAMREAARKLMDGEPLLLFPEGTRGGGDEFLDAKLGVSFLARLAKVPIVPVYLEGTDKALPRGARFFKPAKICVRFGDAINLSGFERKGVIDKKVFDREVAAEVMRGIKVLQEKLKLI